MSSNIDIKKKCKWCEQVFTAHKMSTSYCSHRCASLAYKERVRQERIISYQKELSLKEQNEATKDLEHREFFNPIEATKLLGISRATIYIIRKTKCFDFWERNVLFPKTKRSFFRTPTPSTLPFSA